MSDYLQHDPRTKQQIKDAIYNALYAPVSNVFKARQDALIIKNTLLGCYSHRSFMYKNTLYNCDSQPLPRKMNRLVPSLTDEINSYLLDVKKLNEQEMPYVIGYINQILNSSNDMCDYLRLLPEAIHEPVKRLISTCPCGRKNLSDATVAALQSKNKQSIQLMQRRMITNLLI